MTEKKCPFCDTAMKFHHSHVHHSILRDTDESKVGIYANDIMYKCPKCYFVATFGHPLTKLQYDQYLEAQGGQFNWSKEDTEIIIKRLADLGYMDATE